MDDDNDGVRLVPVPSTSRITGTKPSIHRNVGINISDMVLSLPGGQPVRSNSSSGSAQKKSQGTPIAVPTSERRPSSFSKRSTHNTLITGIRDGGPSSRRKSAIANLHGGFSPPFSPKNIPAPDDYDVVGFIDGYQRRGSGSKETDIDHSPRSLNLEKHGNGKSNVKAAEIVLLSDEDDSHDPKDSKLVKRRKMSQDHHHLFGSSQTTPITVKYGAKSSKPPQTPKPSIQPQSPTTPPSSSRVRHLAPSTSPITPEKVSAMGAGTYPQAQLLGVLFNNDAGLHSPAMRLQFTPDRLVFIIDKVVTRIPHSELKVIEFYTASDINVLLIDTKGPLDASSNLAPHYNPEPHSGKARQLAVFCKMDADQLTNLLKEIRLKGIAVKPLTTDKARIALENFEKQTGMVTNIQATEAEKTNVEQELPKVSSPSRITRSTRRLGSSNTDAVLFTYPFSGGPKSITVHESDVARLEPDQFLNDTIIEFGLKYMQDELEKSNPDLAKQIYVFNTFFYERLSERDGNNSISYSRIKKWTSKVDLFEKKYILVPIHESAHWYLAVITNPGLLLSREKEVTPVDTPDTDTPKEPGSPASKDLPADSPLDSPEASTVEDKPTEKLPAYGTRSLTKPEVDPTAKPYIIVLDSLDLRHPAIFNNLRSYLQHELEAKKGISIKVTNASIVGKYAKWPRQGNHCDCGIFLLHYAKTFLMDPEKMLWSIVNSVNNENMWSDEEITKLRDRYKEDLQTTKIKYAEYQEDKQRMPSTTISTDKGTTTTTSSTPSTSLSSVHSAIKHQSSAPASMSASPSATNSPSSVELHSWIHSDQTNQHHDGHESGEDIGLDPRLDVRTKRRKLDFVLIDTGSEERRQDDSEIKTSETRWKKSGASIEL